MVKKYLNNRFLIVYITPFVLGLIATLSFSPFNLTIINFFIFPLIFFLLSHINKKSKSIYRKRPYKKNFFLFGLLFGFGFYLSGISWIVNSLTHDENFKILIPFALILLPLFLSLFLAFTFLIIGPYLKLDLPSLIIFILSLAIADFVRANVLTGFPWNLWAYSTTWAIEIVQILNKIGLHAYNLLLITFFILPIFFFFNITLVNKLIIFTISCTIILGLFIFGNYEINQNKKLLKNIDEKIFVKIISPNFDLEYDLSNIEIEKRFKKLIRYSEPEKNKTTLFI